VFCGRNFGPLASLITRAVFRIRIHIGSAFDGRLDETNLCPTLYTSSGIYKNCTVCQDDQKLLDLVYSLDLVQMEGIFTVEEGRLNAVGNFSSFI
jgi:hypothetical protein